MANLSEDIQCAGSDTRPSMLDRTDFASWKQYIRLYCQGKENGQLGPERARVYSDLSPEDKDRYNADIRATNILLQGLPKDIYTLINHYTEAKDIWDSVKMLLEGSELIKEDRESQLYDDFEHFCQNKRETIHDYYVRFSKLINDMRNIKMTMSRMQLNSKFVNNMLPKWGRFVTAVKLNRETTVQDGRVVVQNVQGRQNRGQGNNAWGAGAAGYRGAQNRVGNANPGEAKQIKCYNCNGIGHIARNCTQPKRPQNSEYFKDKMLLMQAQENGVALDEEQLLFIAGGQDTAVDEDVEEQVVQDLALNVDNVFQADDCDAFDSDVDEAPTAQTMFMANLSSADPVYDEASLSYDSDILSEVHDNDHYQDAVCEHHEVHEMHDDVQPNYGVDSHTDYTSDSNMIPYDQYVKDNAVPVVQSNVSYVPNDAYMMILNDIYEPSAQYVSVTTQNNVVDNSLTAELATYKEQVELELHSVKLQLTYTINHNKSMVEEVTFVKKDFKQKEDKYLKEFLDMKALKEKVAIGYKNPLCLTHAKQVQPALYNGHEIIKTNHVPAIVHNSEDTLEIAEITKKKMNDKMKDLKCVKKKYLIKMKAESLKEQTTASRPIKALAMYPPNTPAILVPRVLPTKKIFEELEAEVDQNVVNWKHDEIERKNLLITNDNLIADCLSKEVFYIATNYELTVSRFTEMHAAHTVVQARCLELEAELSKLLDKVQKDDHTELVKRFSNLEVNHLNMQLKFQNLKESFGNNTSSPARYAPEFDSVFLIEKMKASIHGKYNAIKKLRMQISQLQETRSKADRTLDFRALDFQFTQLTEKVNVLQEQNELFTTENAKIKQHYKELYDSIKITRAKHINQTTALLTENENLKAQIHENLKCITMDSVKPRVLTTGSVETLREIVDEALVERPLDSSLAFACLYTKHSQELLEYAIGTCPKDFNPRDKKIDTAPLNRKKRVTFVEPCETSPNNTQTHVEQQKMNKTKEPVIPSTRVNGATTASGSKSRSNTKKDRTLPAKINTKKTNRTPTEIGDPTFHTLRIRLFSNADRPLAFGLRLLKTYDGESLHIFGLYTSSLLNAACKKALNPLKKGLLIREGGGKLRKLLKEEEEACLTTKFNNFPKVPNEPKDNSEVAEKQAGNVQTSLTLSSAKLEIQSMVDVPIHQEDPAVQRTPLIDTVTSMVTDKTTSTPTPPTTQAQVQMCSTSCWKDSQENLESFVGGRLRDVDYRLIQRTE
ncbi:retrovirus-related pol polyprotein from transposon TNT 1-94 [Tanacetum coccineum]|uniref:Retrovirus-related pol polyprotein from transposon TNT 1-94 n=1 Tax=Tanacetum coccineum TaxID=301880 RepID=A0ABQ5ARG4_9ASTR